jgi:hypothetical protein
MGTYCPLRTPFAQQKKSPILVFSPQGRGKIRLNLAIVLWLLPGAKMAFWASMESDLAGAMHLQTLPLSIPLVSPKLRDYFKS